jgi:hypothetical protein
MKRRLTIAALGAAALALAAPAHADQQSYLADLSAQGAFMPQGPNQAIAAGYSVCMDLRNGRPPNAITAAFGWGGAWAPAYIEAAQHNLCPDTLGH